MIWESRDGVTVNGRREDGHAVGFVDGSMKQIRSGDWPVFVQTQAQLREQVLARRHSGQGASRGPGPGTTGKPGLSGVY